MIYYININHWGKSIMKKCVLKITVFALLFVLISCSKNSESQNKNNPWIEEQVSVQDEETTKCMKVKRE